MLLEDKVKENSELYRRLVIWSCDNENNGSTHYSNFLTTLAGLILSFSPVILSYNLVVWAYYLKILLSVSMSLTFLSLIFGGVYKLLEKKFFTKWTKLYSSLFSKWNSVEREDDKKVAEAFELGIYEQNKSQSPQWPVIVQTVSLFLGILITTIVFISKVL